MVLFFQIKDIKQKIQISEKMLKEIMGLFKRKTKSIFPMAAGKENARYAARHGRGNFAEIARSL